jgi:hypothetical protein
VANAPGDREQRAEGEDGQKTSFEIELQALSIPRQPKGLARTCAILCDVSVVLFERGGEL